MVLSLLALSTEKVLKVTSDPVLPNLLETLERFGELADIASIEHAVA